MKEILMAIVVVCAVTYIFLAERIEAFIGTHPWTIIIISCVVLAYIFHGPRPKVIRDFGADMRK